MQRYLVVIEKANGNFSAFSPDVPGCVATGETREAVEQEMHAALRKCTCRVSAHFNHS